jgi:hypothetical protein
LDEKVDTQKSISAFGFRLRRFSKKEISGVEEKDLSPLFFQLGDKGGLLGDTTKGIPKSSTGLNLTHHVVRVDDAELDFRCGLDERSAG